MLQRPTGETARRWIPLILVAAGGLAGYFGAWAPGRAAGLTITGGDLAEYVKFVPQLMSGEISLRREIFYLPLCAGSLTASLLAGRRSLPGWLRAPLALAAIPLALAMLPPAWSPGRLIEPEFRLQTLAILICLLMVAAIALTRYLPDRLILGALALLALAAAIFPEWGYVQVQPAIAALYRQALPGGWGFWMTVAGFALAAFWALFQMLSPAQRGRP